MPRMALGEQFGGTAGEKELVTAAMATAASGSGPSDTAEVCTPDGYSLLSAAARTGLLIVHRMQLLEHIGQV